MLKRSVLKISTILMLLSLLTIVFAACGDVEFKVDFIVDDVVYATINTNGKEIVKMPNDPTKEGHVFDGWYWDRDVWQRPFNAESLLKEKLTSNMAIYAKFIEESLTSKEFCVAFNTMGGSSVESQTVLYGGIVAKPIDPTKSGQLFAGWYKEPDCKTEWNFSADTITAELVLYAKWVEDIPESRKYTVAFNSNDGSEVFAFTELVYNTLLNKPTNPTREGFTFVGWYLDNTYAKEWNFELDKVSENITLYARWVDNDDAKGCEIIEFAGFERDNLKLSIVVSNATDSLSLTDAISVSPWATWEVYADEQGATAPITTKEIPLNVGDNTYYILVKSGMGPGTYENVYELNVRRREIYDVTIVYNNGKQNETLSIEEDSVIVLDADKKIAKRGYAFVEWQHNGKTWNISTDKVTKEIGDMQLTAIWSADKYNISFNSNGGSSIASKEVAYDSDFTFEVPEKRGYKFEKWVYSIPATDEESAKDIDLTGADGRSFKKWNITASITAKAVWTPVIYNINYTSLRGASNNNATRYTIEDEITFVDLSKEGYTFNGWLDENNAKIQKIELGSVGNMTIKADWSAIEYTVVFKADDLEIEAKQFDMDDESIDAPSIPEKVGYAAKWESFEFVPRNIVVNAIYTPIVYSITYQNVDGNHDIDTPVNNNANTYTIESETITLKAASKAGYTFVGWYENEALVSEIASGSHGNKVFTAKWNPISYTLTMVLENEDGEYDGHYNNGEENRTTFTIEDEFSFADPVCDIKGYQFKGWYTTKNKVGEKVEGISYQTVGNKKYFAQWQRIDYAISYYNTEEASNDNPITYNVDTATFTLDNPTRVGYDFDGWFADDGLSELATATINKGSVGNLAFYAKWNLHVYSITYNLYDGQNAEGNPATYTYETQKSLEIPTKTGYSFGGWFTNPEFAEKYSEITKGSHGNLVLYAKWYGKPTLVCSDSVEYVNVKDGLTATWFSASGTDTYNNALTVKFTLTDENGNESTSLDDLAGHIVTVRVYVEDVTGNVTYKDLSYIKVYGLPSFHSGTKREMKSTDSISAELFGITATDSFDTSLTPTVTKYSGTIAAGNTIKVKIYAKDSKGNEKTEYIDVKVYGTPTINEQTKTDFKVEDIITVESLGITATDSHKGLATVTIALAKGTQQAGETLTYDVTATDVAGNVVTMAIQVKVYGTPAIFYERTGIKVGEDVVGNAEFNLLLATAVDSFGRLLDVTFTLASGDYTQGSSYVTYEISATDHLGNTAKITTEPLGVYDASALESLTYDALSANLIKATSKGEEFSATATDSFGNAALITIEKADGSAIVAGEQQDIVIVATDKAGNRKISETISNIKVYAMPTVSYVRENYYITVDEDVTFMFTAHDSFGEEISADVTPLGTIDGVMTVKVEATDDVGNTFIKEYSLNVYAMLTTNKNMDAAGTVTVFNQDLQQVDSSMLIEAVTNTGYIFTGWYEGDVKLSDDLNYTFNMPNKNKTYTAMFERCTNHTPDSNCVCTKCGTVHTLDDNCLCSVCGNTIHGIKNGSYCRHNDYIYFGTYPQTKVTDSNLISVLNTLAGSLPSTGYRKKWTSYGYYLNGSVSDYIWYQDIKKDGEKYRGVYFTSYRPNKTNLSGKELDPEQRNNGYYTSTVYWFKYEPIRWQILKKSNGCAVILADLVLDSQQYYHSTVKRTINGKTVYANNYAESDIRAWLNDTFYNTAFNDSQKVLIQTVSVDNSVSSTGKSSNSYVCNSTSDKVWLPSYAEVHNYFSSSSERQKKSSDYAKSQGCATSTSSDYFNKSHWWLRTPSYYYSNWAWYVRLTGGEPTYGSEVTNSDNGVVPALSIKLS